MIFIGFKNISLTEKMKYSYHKIISKCPLCSNQSNLLLYTIDSETATRYLISKKDLIKFASFKKLIERLWKRGTCKKILCKNCLLFYTEPFVGGNEKFYSQVYSSPGKYPSWRWDYKTTLDAIKKQYKETPPGSLLEIGAGTGEFLKNIPIEEIPKKNLFSCEISEAGKKELGKKGIKNYENIWGIKRKFDVVCIFETIEHLDDLNKFFKKIKKMVPIGGHFFISTPTQKTIRFYEEQGAGLDLPPTHVSCWHKKSFEILAKIHGFKVIERKLKRLGFFRKNLNFGLGNFERKKLKTGSLEDKIDNLSSRKLRKAMILIYLIVRSPYSLTKVFMKKLHSSQWVHLEKVKP